MPRLVYSANYLIEANKTNIVPQVVGMVEISSGGFAPGTITAHATFPLPSPYNYDGRLRDVSSIDCSLNGAYGRVSFAITNADLGEVANVAADKYVGWECKVHKIIILEDGTILGILLLHGVITSYTMTDRVVDMDVVTRINVGNTITPRRVNVKCPWVFKGTECGYSGVLTTCNKLYNDADGCSGRSNQHRFGGFPLRLPEASIGAVSGQGGAPTYQLIRDDSAFQLQRAILEFDNTFSVTDDPTNNKTVISVTGGGGGGSGTVTSVALTAPSFLTVTGSPVTTSGTLALALATQNANTVFAGPTTGSAAAPTFRALGLTDLPQIATNRLLGRVTASTGPVEEITPGTGVLTFIQTPSSSSFANAIADGTGSGVAVFDTSPTLTTPRIADIRSSTNRSFLTFVQNGSSVNYFQIGNSVAAGPSSLSGPTIETVGTSTDINFAIKSKGAGNVNISPGGQVNIQNLSSTLPGVLVLQNGTLGGAELAIGSIIFAASLSGSGYYTLPLSDGTSGQALSTNGSGVLSWASYQPLDADLTAIAALTANGLLRKTAGVWAMDSASYLTANQTITLSGDVTGSGATSIATTIANAAVTFAKIQSIATGRLLGRTTGSTGPIEEITPGSGVLTWLQTPTSDNLRNAVTTTSTGTGSLVFATSPTLVTPNIGVATGTSFNSITGLSSTTPSATVTTTAVVGTATAAARADHVHSIADDAVTFAKMQNVSAASRLLGRGSASGGDIEEIAIGTGLSMSSTTLLFSGLTLNTTFDTSADHADISAAANTRYRVNISGLASICNFTLPAGAAGDVVEVQISVGDNAFELILKAPTSGTINGGATNAEWSRVFITGEFVQFTCVAANTWFVSVDGRIPCKAIASSPGTLLPAMSSINTTTEIITFASNHGITTGDGVYFLGGNPPSGTPFNNRTLTYFANTQSATTIKLYDTHANAVSGGATGLVNLTSTTTTDSVYKTEAIAHNTFANIYLDVTVTDIGNLIDTTKRFKVRRSGIYTLAAGCQYEDGTSTSHLCQIILGGADAAGTTAASNLLPARVIANVIVGAVPVPFGIGNVTLTAGDFVFPQTRQQKNLTQAFRYLNLDPYATITEIL